MSDKSREIDSFLKEGLFRGFSRSNSYNELLNLFLFPPPLDCLSRVQCLLSIVDIKTIWTPWRMAYNRMQICMNSLVIISILENENVAINLRYLKSFQMFAPAVTASDKIKFKKNWHWKGRIKVTEEKNGTYAVRSQMFKCMLLIFFS